MKGRSRSRSARARRRAGNGVRSRQGRRARRRCADRSHRRHLRGEPLLRQPLRQVGGRRRPPQRRRRAHDAGQPGRRSLRVPAAERRQPHVAAAAGDVHEHDAPAFSSHFTQRPVQDRRLHRADRHDLPGAGRLRRQRRAEGQPALPGGCTRDLVHRFYQEQYQLNGGKQNRYTTGSDAVGPDAGRTTTPASCRSTRTCTAARAALRDRRPLLPGARSAARSSTTSG